MRGAYTKSTIALAMVTLFTVFTVHAVYGQAYLDPGWTYLYDGNSAAAGSGSGFDALDGTWNHDNGSDQWDGTGIGVGAPGGAVSIDGYLRIQDTGDPRDHGFGDPGSNRKLYFGHDITAEGAPGDILDTGVTLSFRARIATDGILDQTNPDGGGDPSDWPAGGDGYVIHDGGKGPFGIKQADGGVVSFGLALEVEDSTSFTGGGLIMNNLNGAAVSGDVDWQGDDAGTQNVLSLDPTAWHEFWITIAAGGSGTHVVEVYADGSLTPTTFDVTAGTGSDFGGSYIAMGAGSTPQQGAHDIDFMAWAPGVIQPQVPEPSTALLGVFAATGLIGVARRRRKA